MVCLACLLPLFLIPVVNALPLLVNFILAKVYRLFGWEYRKPEGVPTACPFKPAGNKSSQHIGDSQVESEQTKSTLDDAKQD